VESALSVAKVEVQELAIDRLTVAGTRVPAEGFASEDPAALALSERPELVTKT